MARTNIADATDLTIADVLHKRFDALPAESTVAEVKGMVRSELAPAYGLSR